MYFKYCIKLLNQQQKKITLQFKNIISNNNILTYCFKEIIKITKIIYIKHKSA